MSPRLPRRPEQGERRGHRRGQRSRGQRRASPKSSTNTAIPRQLRNKGIALGWVHGPKLRQLVVGFFDRAGIFRQRVQGRGLYTRQVEDRDIKYHECFRGMSPQDVQNEVLRRLLENEGSLLDPGEV